MKRFPEYYSFWHYSGHYALRVVAFLVLVFLMLPILVIMPLSFNSEPFFTFTEGMLSLDPDAYSLRWYQEILDDQKWQLAIRNSFAVGIAAALIATTLGTLAAVGLSSPWMPYKRLITALLLSPMIVPLIIIAAGMFFFYTRFNLVGTFTGLIIAHAALGVPFVIITVTATLSGFDRSLFSAGLSLGAQPVKVFWDIVIPLIRPGVIAGGLFAFVTSFDEVVLVLFLAGPEQRTIPRQMFSGLREQINPTILAVATLLVVLSATLLFTLEALRRRSARLSGSA
ncbi:MAG: ABC transporter permease [Jannaschia helgolandensis]|jgi:putative spermidine/putrescine transport system permease protein|uniref:Putative spermidine/putrescine transport system permease protein n=1 Tax=Jannaschia helgolandensis TaxID=188906 RepID=A0A1H7LEX2_9RHOB|nr:ABC transporter permease [Jannaschia helgolandensis]SEK97398.1 putative spermidine/putrescine transport system permease protein [Jannaschia helgolandensis]|tara:strand:+ start:3680 stop:4528 length:849 start_codon:yes stop_codon:yes gene_type:complete